MILYDYAFMNNEQLYVDSQFKLKVFF